MSHARTPVKVDVFDVKGMDVAWDVTEKSQTDVDEEVGTTACDHEHANWWKENCDEDDEEGRSCI